jgi:hypothetical protein
MARPYGLVGVGREAIFLLFFPLLPRLAFLFPGIVVGTQNLVYCVCHNVLLVCSLPGSTAALFQNSRCVVSRHGEGGGVILDRSILFVTFMPSVIMLLAFRLFLDTSCHLISLTWLE